jgi:hypothetical protein
VPSAGLNRLVVTRSGHEDLHCVVSSRASRGSVGCARPLWAVHGERRKALDLPTPTYGWSRRASTPPGFKQAEALLDGGEAPAAQKQFCVAVLRSP